MTEPENFYEAPVAPLIANSIVVHRPFINFVAGSICWGGAIFGLGITSITVIADIELGLSKGWQEVLLAEFGLRALFPLLFATSAALFVLAGRSFFRVKNRQGIFLSISAFTVVGLVLSITLVLIKYTAG